jgi:hypothetical protein
MPTSTNDTRKTPVMARDIDYAAIAVNNAIADKFGRKCDLKDLEVTANERTITLRDGKHSGEGTRDSLLAAIRAAESYDSLWELLPTEGNAS